MFVKTSYTFFKDSLKAVAQPQHYPPSI